MGTFLALELVGAAGFLFLLLWLAAPRAGLLAPDAAAWATARWLARTRGGRRAAAVLLVLLVLDVVEAVLDPRVSAWLGYDLTPRVHALEGDLVARLQAPFLAGPLHALVLPLALFYLGGFVAALMLPLVAWTAAGDARARRAWIAALVATYVLAAVPYLFLPVTEAGWWRGSGVRPLVEEVLPGVTAALRSGSALDNCLPSLHVSMTVSAWWLARRHGPPALARVTLAVALLMAAAVLVLGVHWVADVVTGIPFGLVCAAVGERVGERVAARVAARGGVTRPASERPPGRST